MSWSLAIDLKWRSSWVEVEIELGVELELGNILINLRIIPNPASFVIPVPTIIYVCLIIDIVN